LVADRETFPRRDMGLVNVIEMHELSKSYGGGWFSRAKAPSLDHLTLAVPAGKIFGFLGPNGAGKSTTIKILLGLVHPTSGSAKILGEPVSNDQVRSRIGYLPENPSFPTHLKAADFLRLMAKVHKVPADQSEERVTSALKLVGLSDRARSVVKEFSRGMLQRLGIAQALINRPELVILDEPLNGLDPYGRRDLKRIFSDLRGSGCTVFFSSHILSDAEDLCDQVSILNRGRLIADGETRQLLDEKPGTSLEEFFFDKVDQDNRGRLGVADADAALESIRREAADSAAS
jgi:ABC-2 type transport system ATP-binding protein